jgi:putative addiction module component (TIGR02574 family)
MKDINNRIIEEALTLPADIRLNLIEKLLKSLNLSINEDIDHLWAKEAERRVSQIEENRTKLIPGEEVFNKIRSKYLK